jgi:membrane protease subunit HflK
MIDIDGGNNLLYLPLDKILEPRMQNSSTMGNSGSSSTNNSLSEKIQNSRDSFNSRKRNLYNE